jgi:GTP1/Obg family GTP-binding protein
MDVYSTILENQIVSGFATLYLDHPFYGKLMSVYSDIINTELDIMEEKSVVASMSNDIILSIEDLQREGCKKLPSFKRGRSSLPCLLTLFQSIFMSTHSRKV